MFRSLDEVKRRWDERYKETGSDIYRIEEPGYSPTEIEAFERAFGFSLHPSLSTVLSRFNLDQVFFGVYLDLTPTWLKKQNFDDQWAPWTHFGDPNFIQVGGSDGYVVYIDNLSGNVYINDHEMSELILQTRSLEQFILIAATLVDHDWPNFRDRLEADAIVDKFLTTLNIQLGREFWNLLARGAI